MKQRESAAACFGDMRRFFRHPDRRSPLPQGMRAAAFLAFGLLASRTGAAPPAVFVEKSVIGEQTKIAISGAGLPEMRGITFACTYSVSSALIMEAIISSPQPATAFSVSVDTAKSSMSISVRAASTMRPADNAGLVVLKINADASGAPWPLTVTKATMADKQGAVSEIPVTVKASIAPIPEALRPSGFRAPWLSGVEVRKQDAGPALFDCGGRKVSGIDRLPARGFFVQSVGRTRFAAAVRIR